MYLFVWDVVFGINEIKKKERWSELENVMFPEILQVFLLILIVEMNYTSKSHKTWNTKYSRKCQYVTKKYDCCVFPLVMFDKCMCYRLICLLFTSFSIFSLLLNTFPLSFLDETKTIQMFFFPMKCVLYVTH